MALQGGQGFCSIVRLFERRKVKNIKKHVTLGYETVLI